jgi:hypothetical protein
MGSGVEIHERKINHGCKSKHDYKTSSVDCNKSRLSWMPSMAIASSLLTIGSPLMTRITDIKEAETLPALRQFAYTKGGYWS